MYFFLYVYLHIYIYTYIHMFIYIYTHRERERETRCISGLGSLQFLCQGFVVLKQFINLAAWWSSSVWEMGAGGFPSPRFWDH